MTGMVRPSFHTTRPLPPSRPLQEDAAILEVAGTRRSAHTSVHSHPRARATPASRQAGRGSRASCPTSRGPAWARTLPQDRKSRTQLCPSVGGLSPPCPASSSTDSDPGPALCPPGSWQPLSAAFPALSVTVLSYLPPCVSLFFSKMTHKMKRGILE